MTSPVPGGQVRLDTHPTHASAVIATVTGPDTAEIVAVLEADAWHTVAEATLVLVRIDREEPHWAQKTADRLTADGVTVAVTPRLQEAIDEEWTWANYPMHWCTREEIREVSDQAQQIHDAIRHERLQIHAHAHDGHTTVAVGTYTTGESIHLHGEDHLRVENYTYGSGQDAKSEALTDFRRFHGDAVRPGPAPLTRTEREADQARRPLPAQPTTTTSRQVSVPVYAADPANAPAVLDRFVTDHPGWDKHHQWPAEATYALHESLTLRVELYHGHALGPQDEMWTIAAYESPVGDRLWHATATAGTPDGVISTLLDSLTDEHDWSSTPWAASTAHPDRKPALPLADYSWEATTTETGSVWTSPEGDCRLQRSQSGWEAQGNQSWTVRFSRHAPPEIIQQVVFELAEGLGPRLGTSLTPRPPAPCPAPRAARPPASGVHSPTPRGR
ncbi:MULTISPECIES: DUF317 domain-containing protein [unclassified Streptomyces]|uniref:DUF317 domain-containing protein n=1 Tax=unclassified Streptomyces TaxID=2593676 RepID=UPI000978F1B7|nr:MULTISPECIES: DUF317 domain-containing protein [unclassified Streptomyces]ONI50024.1 hypothetical protein STIB_57380 [Streptomyces sp. IB2014 011-1]